MSDDSDRPKKRRRKRDRAPADSPFALAAMPYDIATLVSALRRRLRLFLSVVAGFVAVALLVTLAQPRRYTATAEVVLGSSGNRLNAPPTADRATTEVHIIESREMAHAVAAELHLDRDPAFTRAAAGPIAWIGQAVNPAPAISPDATARQIVDRLLHGLAVRQLDGTYSAIVSFTAADPAVAARIANSYARQYSDGRLAGALPGLSPLDRPNARVISTAEPPLAASSPRPVLNLTIGLLLGLLAGIAAALVAERLFAGLTSGAEIEKRLGLHHLGSVPTLASVLPDASSPIDAVVEASLSGFAEAFRSVFMGIRYAGGRGTQVIAITSALPNEGKTTVAVCLARTIALGGEPVVLIDCDARRRDTSALLGGGVTNRPGLAQVLRYEATLDEALVRDHASGAWILPLTGLPSELSDLLSGSAMAGLIEDLRRRFKRVLIDTAPLLPISSTRAIATMADVTVLVVRWRATADHAIVTALRLLPRKHVRIAGAILSHVDLRRQVKYGHGDSTFYYQQYSKYYS